MQKQFIALPNREHAPQGTTQAVRAGNLIFVDGQMSLDGTGNLVGTDVKTQTRNIS